MTTPNLPLTANAKKALQISIIEAKTLNHEYRGTEHVLLGLLCEELRGCDAQKVLQKLEYDPPDVKRRVLSILQVGPHPINDDALPTTPRFRKAIEFAQKEANQFGYKEVGTGHLLMGILLEQESTGGSILIGIGLKIHTAREAVLEVVQHKTHST